MSVNDALDEGESSVVISARGRIAAEANLGKMVLVHIKEKPQRLLDTMVDEISKDYDGEVIIGEDLLEIMG